MNALILSVGGAVVLALTAALIGPYFVDWTSYRAHFEREVSALLGRDVSVRGPVDVRLLPMPIVSFQDVVVAGAEGGRPLATIGSFTLDLSLTPLLRGEYHVSDIVIERAEMYLEVDEDGTLAFAAAQDGAAAPDPDSVLIEHFAVARSAIVLTDRRSGEVRRLDEIRLEGDARSLAGPLRADGAFRYGGVPHTFRLSTGRAEADGLRFKAAVVPADDPRILEVDALARIEGGAPMAEGRFVAQRLVAAGSETDPTAGEDLPWRMEGTFRVDAEDLVISAFELGYGSEDRRAVLTGSARRGLGDGGSLEALIQARQIDLDRLLGEAEQPGPAADRLAMLVSKVPAIADPPERGRVSLDVGGLILSGGVVSDLRVDAAADGGAWRIETAEARLPGGAQAEAAGALAFRPDGELGFDGLVQVETSTFAAFRNWLAGLGEETAAFLPSEQGRFSARAELRTGEGAFVLDDLAVTLGDMVAQGSIMLEPAVGRAPGALIASMAVDRFDLDSLAQGATPDFAAALARAGRPLDLDLRVREVTASGARLGPARLSLALGDGVVDIRSASLGEDAFRIDADGRIEGLADTPEGRFDLTIDADDMGHVAELLRAAGLDAIAAPLALRAAALSPARLAGFMTAGADGEESRTELSLEGTTDGTRLALRARHAGRLDAFEAGHLDLSLEAESEDAAELLAQIGLDAPPPQAGPGRLVVVGAGVPADDLVLDLSFEGAGTRLELAGAAAGFPSPRFAGDISATSDDVARLAGILAVAMPDIDAAGAGAVEARVTLDDGVVRLEGLDARIGGRAARGRLTVNPAQPVRVDGELAVDEADLGWLVALLSGAEAGLAPSPDRGGEVWPAATLRASSLSALRGRILVSAETLRLGEETVLSPARFDLAMRGAETALERFDAGFAGGSLTGSLTARASETEGKILSGDLRLAGARLEDLVWRRDGRPVATGEVSLSGDFQGQGRSLESLVGQLQGGGSFTVSSGEIRGLNPQAFSSIMRAADAGLELTEARVREAFSGHLAAGQLAFDEMQGAFSIASGVLRTRNVQLETPSATSFASLRLDLAPLAIDAELTLAVPSAAGAGEEEPPQVSLTFAGPVLDPERGLDVSALSGFLTVRAFEQEVERLERLQADISERERLSREMRRMNEERARAEREAEEERRRAEEEAEAARRAAEEAEEEARRQAEEAERRRAADEAARRAQQESSPAPPAPQPEQDAGAEAAPGTGPGDNEVLLRRLREALETMPQ